MAVPATGHLPRTNSTWAGHDRPRGVGSALRPRVSRAEVKGLSATAREVSPPHDAEQRVALCAWQVSRVRRQLPGRRSFLQRPSLGITAAGQGEAQSCRGPAFNDSRSAPDVKPQPGAGATDHMVKKPSVAPKYCSLFPASEQRPDGPPIRARHLGQSLPGRCAPAGPGSSATMPRRTRAGCRSAAADRRCHR